MALEYYELGHGDRLDVIVNVTDPEDLSRVNIELGRLYSWTSVEGPEVTPGEDDDEEDTEWLTLVDCASLTGVQSERAAA